MTLWKNSLVFLISVFSLESCSSGPVSLEGGTEVKPEYAKLYSLRQFDGFEELNIVNPWGLGNLATFYLVPDSADVPDIIKGQKNILRTPLKRIACTVSVHVGMLNRLGALDNLKAVAEPQYIFIDQVQESISSGEIIPLGESTDPDIERLASASCDVILISPFENTGYGSIEKLGIPIIPLGEYMENNPLGRAEWIKVIGLLVGKEREAEAIFNLISQHYASISSLAASAGSHPTVLPELKYGQQWYVPAGDSYMVAFFKDAGFDYLWKDSPGTGSIALDFETVYDRAFSSDLWIVKYSSSGENLTYSKLLAMDPTYGNFKAFRQRKVIGCNMSATRYSEDGAMEPDVILADLVHLVHPEILEGHTPKYFNWLEE